MSDALTDPAAMDPAAIDPATGTVVERLRAFFELERGEPVSVVDYCPIAGGYSRSMSKFTIEDAHGRNRYVLRADPPPGTSILETDRAREWAVLKAITAGGTVPMPAARYFDPTGERLGSPAIILDQVDGESLLSRTRTAAEEERRELAERLCGVLLQVHRSPVDALPVDLGRPEDWDRYLDSQIQRWVDLERAHLESVPFMRWVAQWLDRHRPPPAPLGLVHGDFQPPNILIDRDGRFLLVDWELSHIGDPREDLGWWALAAASQPPDLIDENLEAFCELYRAGMGLAEEVLNPLTIAYFTVLASIEVYGSLLKQGAAMARGEGQSMSIAYMTVAEPFMHGVWLDAIDRITAAGVAR